MRLNKFGGFDRRERCALLDGVAQSGNDSNHAAGIRRKQRGRAIAVDRYLSLGQFLADEGAHAHGLHGQGLHLLRGGAESTWRSRRLADGCLVFAEKPPSQPDGQKTENDDDCSNGCRAYLALARPGASIDGLLAGRLMRRVARNIAHALALYRKPLR